MRSILFFLILFAAVGAAGYGAAKWKAIELLSSKIGAVHAESKPAEFLPTAYPQENLPFCVIIIGRNNGAHVEKTLESVFAQNYEPFRVVYIDDASDDGSADLARDLMYASRRFTQVHFHPNEQPLGPLANIAKVLQGCADGEIAVLLNGEDWLAHEWVLTRLNQYYSDPDLWLAYGSSRNYPTYEIDQASSFEKGKAIRGHHATSFPLKTFYAGLFKKIGETDFQYKGEYLKSASDLALMFPMLEMAQGHFQCLRDILYISNQDSLREEDEELEAFCQKHLQSLSPYPRLALLEVSKDREE